MRERPEDLLKRYEISAKNGFLPSNKPLERLPDAYYAPWESLAQNLTQYIAQDEIRQRIDDLPILDTSGLNTESEWQRACVILGFLTHAYIWCGLEPSQRLPPQLSKPFIVVADYFGLPSIATFASLSLLNFRTVPEDADWSEPDNLKSLLSFTGTTDEEWFFVLSTAIEARGAPLIFAMLECIQAADMEDDDVVLSSLQTVTRGIRDIGRLLQRMHERCDPQVFYHNLRPFIAGTKGMATAGLPHGVFYDEGDGRGHWRQYSGGSNAQSSLIQLFDVFLSVDHHIVEKAKTGTPAPSNSVYLKGIRNYMPQTHREFLTHMEQISTVRSYISRPSTPAALLAAYNDAVAALTSLRDIHVQIVARYIVAPSRSPPAPYIVTRKGINLATASSAEENRRDQAAEVGDRNGLVRKELHGTGGTSVMPFLKKTRDETRQTAIVSSS